MFLTLLSNTYDKVFWQWSTLQVVTVPHHSTGHYKRSMEDAHQLAYVGYVPATLGAVPAPGSASSRIDQLQGIRR